jgi:hypothetical protein
VVDESRHHVLALTDAGWGVWKKGDPPGEPLALFPPDDEGFELASDYFREARRASRTSGIPWSVVLRWSAVISGGVWVVSSLVLQTRFYLMRNPLRGFEGDELLLRWATALSQIAEPVFFVSVGLLVVLWLKERQPS